MATYDYDIIVLGGGSGGLVSSKLAAGLGKKVLLIEKNKLGGECSFSGCVPSKAFIRACKAYNEAKNLSRFSIKGKGSYDKGSALKYVRSIVDKVAAEHQPKDFEKFGIKIKFGNPQFVDKNTIKLKGKNITAGKFIIATGSSPFIPSIEGLDKVDYLTNDTFFEQKKLPGSFAVLGGGPIGIELAQSLNRLDIKTTVIEKNNGILVKDDRELSEMLKEILIEEGLNLMLKTEAAAVEKHRNKIVISYKGRRKGKIYADALLVAVGRKPNTEGLMLENAGVQNTALGITVNDKMQTTAENIYACGDVVGPYQFSHVAEYQAVTAGTNACLPITRKVDYTNVLWTTFTDPELAHVGLTEEEARERYGDKIKVHRYKYEHLERAVTDSTEDGLGKFILDKKGYLLGAHILGHAAGDLIHEAQILRSMKIKFSKIQSVMHGYPTYSDITRQTGKYVYIDELQNNPIIKLAKFFKKNK